ncbi:MAG: hypothetical protein EPN23_07230 [Verrucomicrobia bacterium]|nr:MAG: hypothetical protein EPN23_07230 [Verrucomicrobiota bacterium]
MLALIGWCVSAQPVMARYVVLHSFANGSGDGASPVGSLTLSGSTLYGMPASGGWRASGI